MTNESQETETAGQPPEGAQPVRTVAELEAEMAQMKDQLLRAVADAENGRRRAERDAAEGKLYAIDRFARDLLAVADNLGRAVLSAEPGPASADPAFANLVEGVKMTEAALNDVLAKHGVRRVGVRGDKFDPNVHQAVSQAPSDVAAGCIADVLQPGYVLADRTLRAAMVIVSVGESQRVDIKA